MKLRAVLALTASLAATSPCLAQMAGPSIGRPTGGEYREPWLQPFSAQSVWNTPLGRGAIFQDGKALETSTYLNRNAGQINGAVRIIGFPEYPVFKGKPTDPVVRWTYQHRAGTLPWPFVSTKNEFFLRMPAEIPTYDEGDGHMVIVSDDGEFAYEMWLARFDKKTREYTVGYVVRTNLYGPGIAQRDGISEGIRAAGMSMFGGLIRCYELERKHIQHALSMMASQHQLKKGATMNDQKVWPATHTDGSGKNNYSGSVPMGALFGIPSTVDLTKIGIKTPEGMALARAFQEFGGYIVDTATNTSKLAMVEDGCDKKMVDNLFVDMDVIQDNLRMVVNNTPQSPGGPGERVAPPPPPLKPRGQ
ncbi:hypothetical protein [Alsobacter sp. R-9]